MNIQIEFDFDLLVYNLRKNLAKLKPALAITEGVFNDINTMKNLTTNYDVFPKKIVDFFGYDNETLFSVKLNEYNVPVQWLDNQWHYFFDRQGFIPKDVKFVHAINKDFDVCWRRYYA